jgi:hypothetical protein
MPFLLISACLFPVNCAVAQFTKRKYEEAFPAVLLGLMAAGYLLGLFGISFAAVVLFYGIIVTSVVYLVHTAIKKKNLKLSAFGFGILVVLFFCALLWWVCKNQRYANWDEFSHWGRAIKGMLAENKLPAVTSFKDTHKNYPPGVAVLQYILLKATGTGFREDAAIYIQGILSVSMLLYMLKVVEKPKTNITKLLLAGVAFAMPMLVFYSYYKETTVDGLLGVMFALVLVIQFLGKRERFDRVLQCLACAVLPTIKSTGMLLALCAGFIILADELRYLNAGLGKKEKAPLRTGAKTAAIALAGPAVGAVFSIAWSIFIKIHHVAVRHEVEGFQIGDVWTFITKGEPVYLMDTLRNYLKEIFLNFNYGNLSFGNTNPVGFFPYMMWFLVFFGVFFLVRRSVPNEHKRSFGTIFYGLMISGALFVFAVLMSYLFIFDEMEAVILASVSRYLNTYIAAVAVFLASSFCVVLPRLKWPKRTACFAVIMIFFFLLGGIPPKLAWRYIVRPSFYAAETAEDIEPYRRAADVISGAAQGEGELMVYVIAQNDYGETTLLLDYELLPNNLPEHVSSICEPYRNPDAWTLAITAEDWMKLLVDDGYKYLYLMNVDGVFVEDYGHLFQNQDDIVNGAMFAIKPGAQGYYFERIL